MKPLEAKLPPEIDSYVQKYLQDHFGPADLRSNAPLFAAVLRLQKFAASVATDEFHSQIRAVLPSCKMPEAATELIDNIANAFCPSFAAIESELLKKSLQEALLTSINVEGDATVDQFRELLQRFLRRHGTVGFVRLFVGIHMFNMMWFDLHYSEAVPRQSEQALSAIIPILERACRAKASAAVRRLIE